MKVVFTERARSDLLEIQDFIASDNPTAALAVIRDIRAKVRGLETFPESGHRRPDLTESDVRFLTVYHFHIVYRPRNDCIEVITILSGYRDLPRHLRV